MYNNVKFSDWCAQALINHNKWKLDFFIVYVNVHNVGNS